LMTRRGRHTLSGYLAERGRSLAESVRLVYYDDLYRTKTLRRHATIFMDLDRLTPAQRQVLLPVHERLAGGRSPAGILNPPDRCLGRFELLRALHQKGVNHFRAIRLSDPWNKLRYPVFLRQDRQHTGALTPLLNSPDELRCAIREKRWLGYRTDDLLIVEFCITIDQTGHYRKYSAMIMGDRILPRYLHVDRRWVVKSSRPVADEFRDEMLAYMADNPHADVLRPIFELAGISYGRIDYGLQDGQPQVWEINTNPFLGRNRKAPADRSPGRAESPALQEVRARFHEQLLAGFNELVHFPAGGMEVSIADLADSLAALRPPALEAPRDAFHRFVETPVTRFPRLQAVIRSTARRLSRRRC